MNWFKRTQQIGDWDQIYMELEQELHRPPTNDEIQDRMLQKSFSKTKGPALQPVLV